MDYMRMPRERLTPATYAPRRVRLPRLRGLTGAITWLSIAAAVAAGDAVARLLVGC